MMTRNKYTKEHYDWMRENCKDKQVKISAHLFWEKFNLPMSESALQNQLHKLGIKTTFRNYYPKGNIPFNKGLKQEDFMSNDKINASKRTRFKNGHMPKNYRPVGSERINADGIIEVKISDSKKWKSKHSVIWEENNGAIPKGSIVIFADGNPLNLSLSNLILVSRKEHVRMAQNGLFYKNNTEATKCGLNIAKVLIKTSELKRNA